MFLSDKKFDILFGMHASMSAHFFYPMIKAKRKIGMDRKRSRDFHGLFVSERIEYKREHAVEMYMQFPKKIGVENFHYDARIPLGKEDYESAQNIVGEGEYFVVNPGSKKLSCMWEFESYVKTIKKIVNAYGIRPVITGGPNEVFYCKRLAKEIPEALCISGQTSLRELTAILEHATFMISPDTGPAHIASAMGTPVVGLFALTRPEITGPFYSQETVINKFDEAILKLNPKKFSYRESIIRNHLDGAMKLIHVDEVMRMVDRIMRVSSLEVSQSQYDVPLVK